MTARSAGLDAAFAEVLDDAISARNERHSREQAAQSMHLSLVEAFLARAAGALDIAATTIADRAERLGLDSPPEVHHRIDQQGAGTIAGHVYITMTRPGRIPDALGGPPPSRRYAWTMRVSLYIEHGGAATSPKFVIEGHRDGWWDWWACDIPTAECNPAGLSLSSSGEEVARRFMTWFAGYVA